MKEACSASGKCRAFSYRDRYHVGAVSNTLSNLVTMLSAGDNDICLSLKSCFLHNPLSFNSLEGIITDLLPLLQEGESLLSYAFCLLGVLAALPLLTLLMYSKVLDNIKVVLDVSASGDVLEDTCSGPARIWENYPYDDCLVYSFIRKCCDPDYCQVYRNLRDLVASSSLLCDP